MIVSRQGRREIALRPSGAGGSVARFPGASNSENVGDLNVGGTAPSESVGRGMEIA
ncbi:hypothetical protein SAMN05216212_1155 [Microbulbifer yueqingensis]|uniref:Uncharacterized protein n=1 Tax=Microbulbifer yueqingensis TaxID=658219 RepID=A0A1G8XLW9_9GAMM|nr:hypothetical protein SAMN05216212_1155 [Microbulbifer yueqingensis]